jgi:tRNA (cmo5U34)-methyltransferase
MKLSVDEIRARYEKDVERFSNLETGQTATVDAVLSLELVTQAAAVTTPGARDLLDIGCGAGNYTLKMLERVPDLNCTLVDLSQSMLDRARDRVAEHTRGRVQTLAGDMREAAFGEEAFDIVLASATLHHLRAEEEWRAMFARILRALRPGGSFWVSDIVEHTAPEVQAMMWERYGEYLMALKGGGPPGKRYRKVVFDAIAEEDTPRPVLFQLNLMREVGFVDLDVLHKNTVYAAFGGRRARSP